MRVSSLIVWLLCCCVSAGEVPDGKAVYQNFCLPCHGTAGEGNVTVKAPSIAGLPAWYLETQMENFRAGLRGTHAQDVEGQMMRSMATALNANLIKAVAAHVSTLPQVRERPSPSVDVAQGRQLYEERCMECHRYNGSGEVVFRSPPLTGLPAWYLMAQMRKFKAGIRGAAPQDELGKKMVLSASYVEDEEMLTSLAAYVATLEMEAIPAIK